MAYNSADDIDFWADYKRKSAHYVPDPELDALIIKRRNDRRKLEGLPLMVQQMFTLMDDLQQLTYDGCVLDHEAIGAIQAKLIILRINLNVHFGVNTQQLHERRSSDGMATGLGQQ